MAAACRVFNSAARNRLAEPAEVRCDATIRKIRDHDDGRSLFHHGQELVVDIFVAHAVRKRIDSSAQQSLCILESEDVGRNTKSVFVSFVDDGAVEFRSELLVHAIAVIHPDLHKIYLLGGELLDRLSTFGDG